MSENPIDVGLEGFEKEICESKDNLVDGLDLETVKEGFNYWIDQFKESILEREFTDPEKRGRVQRIEDDDSLKFRFITEFNFSITKLKKEEKEEE